MEVAVIASAYRSVMNADANPLRTLPKPVRLQLMVALSWMWSLIFAAWIGSTVAFGASVVAHMLLLLGVMVTAEMFRRAEERGRDHDGPLTDHANGATAGEAPHWRQELRPATTTRMTHPTVRS